MTDYPSAKEAYESLNVGRTFDKRMIARKLRKIAACMDVKLPGFARSVKDLLWLIFVNHYQISRKSVRCAQITGTDKFIVFADVYDTEEHLYGFTERFINTDIRMEVFAVTYPKNDKWAPEHHRGQNNGYDYFYRGILNGIIIDI